jgi:hypothetical protein
VSEEARAKAYEAEAKLAFDQQSACVTAQRNDLTQLQTKAKDVVGLLTLAGTFLAAFAKDATNTLLSQLDQPQEYLPFAILPIASLVLALLVMRPDKSWAFNLDGDRMREVILARPDHQKAYLDSATLYLAYTTRFAALYDSNFKRLRRRMYLLWATYIGVACTVIVTVGLFIHNADTQGV